MKQPLFEETKVLLTETGKPWILMLSRMMASDNSCQTFSIHAFVKMTMDNDSGILLSKRNSICLH